MTLATFPSFLIMVLTVILIAVPAANASLTVSSGLFDAATGQFYQVDTVNPADPYATSLTHTHTGVFDLSDTNTLFLTGGYTATSIAQYGHLSTFVGGSVAGSTSFPLITIYASAFFFDTLTFTTANGGNGTAYLKVEVDGSGSVTDALGKAPESPGVGVYGSSYASVLAGEVGTGIAFNRVTDVTNTSADQIILSTPIPFVSGVPVDIEVALSSNLYLRCSATTSFPNACSQWAGMGMTDFSHSALLTGIELFDTTGSPISGFDVSSTSGTSYGENGVLATPEPSFTMLCWLGFGILGVIEYRKFRCLDRGAETRSWLGDPGESRGE